MDLIATGRVCKPFGLDGFVKVESFSGEFEHFLELEKVFLKFSEKTPKKLILKGRHDDWFEVEEIKLRSMDALMKFKGIGNPEDAKTLKGAEMFVPRDKASPLEDGDFYVKDLCNCVLVHKDSEIGKITSVTEGGGAYLLEISEAATGKTHLVPFNKEFIGEINLEQKTVELMHLWIIE